MNTVLATYKNVYFIGIGGIGMSALARWFMSQGYQVGGYDKTPSPLLEQLAAEGSFVHLSDDITQVPEKFRKSPAETLVVYTPAVPRLHSELIYFQNQQFRVLKRAAVLGMISQEFPTIGVAGTHGKTTTTTLIAHLLKTANINSGAFLGGISSNYRSNLLLPQQPNQESWVVVEADEYDRSFLQLYPAIAVITAIEADHLDIYLTAEAVVQAFTDYLAQVKDGGFVAHHARVTLPQVKTGISVKSYGIGEGDIQAKNIRTEQHAFAFDLFIEGVTFGTFLLPVPGLHNVENALAAIAVGLHLNIEVNIIKQAIASFKGVQRRFDFHIKENDRVYIDDYAHHPTELSAFVRSVKMLYPQWPLTLVFQPHLFSRTRDFADEFADALSLADEVILLDIYPAREQPITGITSAWLLQKIKHSQKQLLTKEEVLKYIEQKQPVCLATAGAGDIDRLVPAIVKILKQ